jgi:hypothetical protein
MYGIKWRHHEPEGASLSPPRTPMPRPTTLSSYSLC